jgi:hypothetical protein
LALTVGDVDNDGKNEMVVGRSWYGRDVVILKKENETYNVSYLSSGGFDVDSVSIGDVDNDTLNELVVGTSCWGGLPGPGGETH